MPHAVRLCSWSVGDEYVEVAAVITVREKVIFKRADYENARAAVLERVAAMLNCDQSRLHIVEEHKP